MIITRDMRRLQFHLDFGATKLPCNMAALVSACALSSPNYSAMVLALHGASHHDLEESSSPDAIDVLIQSCKTAIDDPLLALISATQIKNFVEARRS